MRIFEANMGEKQNLADWMAGRSVVSEPFSRLLTGIKSGNYHVPRKVSLVQTHSLRGLM
jgi:hypothetical protein